MTFKDILKKGKAFTPRFGGSSPRSEHLSAHIFPTKTDVHVKGLTYHAKSLVNDFSLKLTKQLNHNPLIEKASVLVKGEKQGNLYTAIVSLVTKGKKGIVIKTEGRNIQALTQQITKKVRNLLSKK